MSEYLLGLLQSRSVVINQCGLTPNQICAQGELAVSTPYFNGFDDVGRVERFFDQAVEIDPSRSGRRILEGQVDVSQRKGFSIPGADALQVAVRTRVLGHV